LVTIFLDIFIRKQRFEENSEKGYKIWKLSIY
jgi:hypothetical protein